MAFPDFVFPEAAQELGLSLAEADLFGRVPPRDLPAGFAERLQDGVELALAVHTEKARSEFVIAPLLLELRRSMAGSFGLFSGVEFNVDSDRGLNGYCDFILTRSPMQSVLTAPLVAIVEAKNDNLRSGLGQCIAAMVAAREFNASAGDVYGVVTTGTSWKFLRLSGAAVTLDRREYLVSEPGRIMGVLASILEAS